MSDLVERLRRTRIDARVNMIWQSELCEEAADEIERLRAELEQYIDIEESLHSAGMIAAERLERAEKAESEVEALRALLREVRIARDEPFGNHLEKLWNRIDAALRGKESA